MAKITLAFDEIDWNRFTGWNEAIYRHKQSTPALQSLKKPGTPHSLKRRFASRRYVEIDGKAMKISIYTLNAFQAFFRFLFYPRLNAKYYLASLKRVGVLTQKSEMRKKEIREKTTALWQKKFRPEEPFDTTKSGNQTDPFVAPPSSDPPHSPPSKKDPFPVLGTTQTATLPQTTPPPPAASPPSEQNLLKQIEDAFETKEQEKAYQVLRSFIDQKPWDFHIAFRLFFAYETEATKKKRNGLENFFFRERRNALRRETSLEFYRFLVVACIQDFSLSAAQAPEKKQEYADFLMKIIDKAPEQIKSFSWKKDEWSSWPWPQNTEKSFPLMVEREFSLVQIGLGAFFFSHSPPDPVLVKPLGKLFNTVWDGDNVAKDNDIKSLFQALRKFQNEESTICQGKQSLLSEIYAMIRSKYPKLWFGWQEEEDARSGKA